MHHWLKDCLGQVRQGDLGELAGLMVPARHVASISTDIFTSQSKFLQSHVFFSLFFFLSFILMGSGLDTATFSPRATLQHSKDEMSAKLICFMNFSASSK